MGNGRGTFSYCFSGRDCKIVEYEMATKCFWYIGLLPPLSVRLASRDLKRGSDGTKWTGGIVLLGKNMPFPSGWLLITVRKWEVSWYQISRPPSEFYSWVMVIIMVTVIPSSPSGVICTFCYSIFSSCMLPCAFIHHQFICSQDSLHSCSSITEKN